MPIGPLNPAIQSALSRGDLSGTKPPVTEGEGNFAQALGQALKDVNAMQGESRQLQNDYMSGAKPVELHDLMISMEKASTAMQLTLAVRNKALEAFQEINRLQV